MITRADRTALETARQQSASGALPSLSFQDFIKLRGKVTRITLTCEAALELANVMKGLASDTTPLAPGQVATLAGIDFFVEQSTPEDLKARQARHLRIDGVWACPACPYGYEQYMIATDMHVCAVCGYKGGPLPQKQADANPAAA